MFNSSYNISLLTLSLVRSTNFLVRRFFLLGLLDSDPSAFYARENFFPLREQILANKKRFHSG